MCEKRKKERVGNQKRRPETLSKREKPLSSFFFPSSYCCPRRARLLGLLHNAGPLRAAHCRLSCHFTLVSLWGTAAPEGLDTLVMKGRAPDTHAHAQWVDKDAFGPNGNARRTSIKAPNRTITVTLFLPWLYTLPVSLPPAPDMHTRTFFFYGTHSKKNMFS